MDSQILEFLKSQVDHIDNIEKNKSQNEGYKLAHQTTPTNEDHPSEPEFNANTSDKKGIQQHRPTS